MFTHTGNQLAAVTTTDPAHVGEGYVWTTDPATGQTHGQIALTTSDTNDTPTNPAATWSQPRVDATYYALVCNLAGAPQELINTTTGVVEGHTTQILYCPRTWTGTHTSPLLFAGQYEDAESGWAYNRFRYCNPTLGAYNAQDPLGLAPRLASAQGYVDHAAHWVDVLGPVGKEVYKSAPGHVFAPHKQLRTMGGGTETNLDRMARGKAPIGHDGKFVNLHHIGQSDSSTLVELTVTRHSQNRAQLHIFHGLSRNDCPKDVVPVDRSAFDAWREQYWIERAKDFR
nr:HNH/ENDO VII family nuclease [Corynebacterium macclintockiae]